MLPNSTKLLPGYPSIGKLSEEQDAVVPVLEPSRLAIPPQETSWVQVFGQAQKRYTPRKNFTEGVRGYLFQGRFSSCVLDELHLLELQ